MDDNGPRLGYVGASRPAHRAARGCPLRKRPAVLRRELYDRSVSYWAIMLAVGVALIVLTFLLVWPR